MFEGTDILQEIKKGPKHFTRNKKKDQNIQKWCIGKRKRIVRERAEDGELLFQIEGTIFISLW